MLSFNTPDAEGQDPDDAETAKNHGADGSQGEFDADAAGTTAEGADVVRGDDAMPGDDRDPDLLAHELAELIVQHPFLISDAVPGDGRDSDTIAKIRELAAQIVAETTAPVNSVRRSITRPRLSSHAQNYPPLIPNATRFGLTADHERELKEKSGISDKAIVARDCCTMEDNEVGRRWRSRHYFTPEQRRLGRGIIFPLYSWFGTIFGIVGYMLQPDNPRLDSRGKVIRYETALGRSWRIDVPPLTRHLIGDPSTPLVLTSGVREADSAASQGLPAINLNILDGFSSSNVQCRSYAWREFEKTLREGGFRTGWGARCVLLVFDLDLVADEAACRALCHIANYLISHGALVRIVALPHGPEGKNTGLDDFFARGHTADDLDALARTVVGSACRASFQPRQ